MTALVELNLLLCLAIGSDVQCELKSIESHLTSKTWDCANYMERFEASGHEQIMFAKSATDYEGRFSIVGTDKTGDWKISFENYYSVRRYYIDLHYDKSEYPSERYAIECPMGIVSMKLKLDTHYAQVYRARELTRKI